MTHLSILARALLAVILMIGFYLLALSISAGLLYIPYAEVVYTHHITPKLMLLCIFAALAILWSILPRFDKFPPPGPKLTREQHPRLFNELDAVANATKQTMPAEVFLIPDVNAWVAQRGGIMGFGSRRVMGLGLPLMRTLTCSQFRAVLAHEFGHYYGGDTRLGPWIYKTRNTIVRTLTSLRRGSWVQLPFLWYGKMYLRITHAVSRRQEFIADELAARTVGAKPLADGLRVIHGVGPAFSAYWRNVCAPVLQSGFCPPLVEGFEKFIQADHIAEAVNKHVDEQIKTGKASAYDTHPSLKDRIAALAKLPDGASPAEDPPALSLIENIPALESELLVTIAGAQAAQKLKPLQWSEVGSRVYLPQWQQLVKANAQALNGVTVDSLPTLATDLKQFGARFVNLSGQNVTAEQAPGLAGAVVGAALCVLLLNDGATVDATPGRSITLTRGRTVLEPFTLLPSLATGKITAEAWMQQCRDLEIAGKGVGPLVGLP